MRFVAPYLFASGCLVLVVVAAHVAGCDGVGGVASEVAAAYGAEHNAYCDRRFITGGKSRPTAFCQEVVETLAAQRFIEDCEQKHGGKTDIGRCPAEKIIAGCKVGKRNEDGSVVYDWYYDVRELEASDAGKLPDGGPVWLGPPRTPDDVRALCSDRTLYDEGATYIAP